MSHIRYELSISLSEGDDGYSPGTWAWAVSDGDGNGWIDGGYQSREMALESVRQLLQRLEERGA